MCVNVLSEGPKVLKVSGLAHVADLVFDSVGETGIEFMTEGGFPIATKLRAETVELDEVTDNVMSFLHMKVVELVLSVADRIMGTELAREFCEKLMPVVHPVEGPRTVLEVQLTLNEESAKLFRFSTVEGVRFADSGSQRRLVSSARVASQQTNRTREIVKNDEGGVCVGWEVVVIKVIIVEVGVVQIIPRIITGTFATRQTTCRGDQFTTHEGVFIVAGGGGATG